MVAAMLGEHQSNRNGKSFLSGVWQLWNTTFSYVYVPLSQKLAPKHYKQ